MANLKASKKDIRKIEKRTQRAKHARTRLKTLGKKVISLTSEGNAEALKAAAVAFVSALDKATKQGIIHTNKANRHKSSVAKYIFA